MSSLVNSIALHLVKVLAGNGSTSLVKRERSGSTPDGTTKEDEPGRRTGTASKAAGSDRSGFQVLRLPLWYNYHMCKACEANDHENCADWRPVPEGPVRQLFKAVFDSDNPQQCCCEE